MKMITKGILIVSCVVIIGLVTIAVLFSVPAYREWAFICENTCSRKGYCQWVFGLKTDHWYEKSPLEDFIQSEDPNALVYRWMSYAGTEKNIFGQTILYGHGRPRAIIKLDHEVLRMWIQKNDDETVRQFYDLLVSDNQKEIEKQVEDMWQEFMNPKE